MPSGCPQGFSALLPGHLKLSDSLLWDAVLCMVGIKAASLVSTCWIPVAPQTASRDHLPSGVAWGEKLPPLENYRFREIEKGEGLFCALFFFLNNKPYRALYHSHLCACSTLKKEWERERKKGS